MSPVSRGRKSKKQKKAQKSRQRSARVAVQREDTQFADLLAAGSQPGQPSSGFRALAALVDQLAGPRERPAWFGPSIGRVLRQEDAVIAATGPRELEQAVTELTGAEMYWALNEAKMGLWFEWWFEELVRAAADRVKAEAAGEGASWQAPWRLLHGLAAIGSPALRSAAMQAVKDAGRALTRQQSAAAPDWLGLCPEGSVTGGIWAMRDDYRTRFAVLAECGYPGGVDPHVFLLDIDACVTVTPADAAVFDSLDQAVASGRPVFVDFTADWCITCKTNERFAIDTPQVRDAFAKLKVVLLKADWTNGDPEITDILRQHGRAGVPMYLVYPGGSREPVLLSEVISSQTILDALNKSPVGLSKR